MIYNERYIPLLDDKSRYLVLGGGSSSGKSFFIAQKILNRCFTPKRQGFLCLRTTGPTARSSIWELFKSILIENDVYKLVHVNETQMKMTFPNGTFIICRGLDELQKIKSIVGITGQWLEEAIEFTIKEFLELQRRMRAVQNTYKQTIISFNPDDYYHWIKELFFDETTPANERYKRKSTVLMTSIEDNKFATKEDLEELDALKEQDDNEYQIYRFGNWAIPRNVIYTHFKIIDEFPTGFDEVIYGMDFGYTDPSAIVEIGILDHQYYVKEILYESGLTATQMLDRVKQVIPNRNALIYADSNRPEYIKELEDTFYGIRGAEKGPGSVINGIDIVKKSKVFLDANSPNLLREARNYRKREVNGRILDEPVKNNDHTLDGLRYALMEHLEGTLPAGWL